MRNRFPVRACLLACALLAVASTLAPAQAAPAAPAKPATPAVGTAIPPAQSFGRLLSGMEQEFVSAAEAMPEDKFNFAPDPKLGEFKGVRTFAAQIKHVAQSNYYFFGGPDYSEAGDKAMSDAIDKLTTKAEIVKALKDSFLKAHALVDGMTAENAFVQTAHGTRAGMVAFGLAHMMDHYGQLVVYLRMNGIVPPASRGSM
ncbi:MAG: DinB family protein [Terracidiphilus sp.]